MDTKRFAHVRQHHVGLLALFVAMSVMAFVVPVSAKMTPNATVRTYRTCYTPGQQMRLTGSGYTPGGQVMITISLSGASSSELLSPSNPWVADPTGAVFGSFPAPDLASSEDVREQAILTATDAATHAAIFAWTRFTLSAFGVKVDNPRWSHSFSHIVGDPRQLTRFRLIGFEPATRAWVHYRFGGRTIKTVPLGALNGPCGNLTKRMREFPFRPVRAGLWTVVFSGTSRFDPRSEYIRAAVRVPRAKAVP